MRTIVFDLDGTLLNTLEDLMTADNYALTKFGYPLKTLQEVRKFVGNGLGKLVSRSLPDEENNPDYPAVLECLKTYYAAHSIVKTKPYDGVVEVMQQLKDSGHTLAIVSNKPDQQVKELAARFFPGLTTITVGEKAGVKRKPAADTVNVVLDYLHIKPEDAVYIGDSEVDVLTAKNSRLDCIAVSWGFRDVDFLKENGATTIVHSPKELLSTIASMEN